MSTTLKKCELIYKLSNYNFLHLKLVMSERKGCELYDKLSIDQIQIRLMPLLQACQIINACYKE